HRIQMESTRLAAMLDRPGVGTAAPAWVLFSLTSPRFLPKTKGAQNLSLRFDSYPFRPSRGGIVWPAGIFAPKKFWAVKIPRTADYRQGAGRNARPYACKADALPNRTRAAARITLHVRRAGACCR